MPDLILPPSVAFDLERERMVERHARLAWFDRQLKEIDTLLELVKASEHAAAPGMEPGYWHVHRRNEQTIDSYVPIKGPVGEFVEPSSGWLDRFRADDAWSNGGWDELKRRWDAREAARAKDKRQRRDDKIVEFAERLKAHSDPSIRFGGTWTAKAGARRPA